MGKQGVVLLSETGLEEKTVLTTRTRGIVGIQDGCMHVQHIRAANCVDRILDFVSGDLLAKASVTRPAISFDLLLARSCLPRARRSFLTPIDSFALLR